MDIIVFIFIFAGILLLQTALFNKFTFHKLDYRCGFSTSKAHEGDEVYLVETIYNRKLLPVPWLKVDIHSSAWLDFAQTCSVKAQDSRRVTSSFMLKGYQKITRRWKVKCLKRGVFETENVTLISGGLLGTNIISVPVKVNASIMVYPATVDIDEMFTPINLMQSENVVKRWIVEDPFVVAGAREYSPGDPLNRIHWPSSAKTGSLMVKNNEFTSKRSQTVLLNMQSKLYEQSDIINKQRAELGIKVAATLFDRALADGTPVRFGTNGCIAPNNHDIIFTAEGADREHISGLFEILARLRMKNVKNFEDLLEEVKEDMDNTEVVIITAYLSKEMCRLADELSLDGNGVNILLTDTVFEDNVIPKAAGFSALSKEIEPEWNKGVKGA